MSLLDTLRKKLSPEQLAEVTDALGDDFDYDVVPRSRLNKVVTQRNELKAQMAVLDQVGAKPATTIQASSAAGATNTDDDFGTDLSAVRQSYESKISEIEKSMQDQINQVHIQYAFLSALKDAQAIDPEIIYSSNVLDKSKVAIDDRGKVTGVTEAIEALKTAKPHLFSQEFGGQSAASDIVGTGKTGGTNPPGVHSMKDFLAMSAEQQMAYKDAHPQAFSSLVASADSMF